MGQADAEHPTQGRPLDGRLDWQPPSQLLTPRSILRSFSSTDSSPAVGDVPRDTVRLTVLRVTARCWGLCDLATGFGAWTVMLGRAVGAELGSVRDIAVPLSNTVDRTARAEGATRLDDILITRTPQSGAVTCIIHARNKAFETSIRRSAATSLSPKRKTGITGIVRCISRISACARFEIFYVGPAGRYITLQNGMSLASAVGYSGVYGQSGPHSRRRR
jgi:hypothetical protein